MGGYGPTLSHDPETSRHPLNPDPLHFRKVRHKNLVCLLGVILHNGLYIVMEFMSKVRAPGQSLASRTWRCSDLGTKSPYGG